MSKFTQGKWEPFFDCDNKGNYIYAWIGASDNEKHNVWEDIALVSGMKVNPGRTKANARLIAAAPEMYELLEEANQIFYLWRRTHNDDDERRAIIHELNERYKNFEINSMNLLARIDGEDDNHD